MPKPGCCYLDLGSFQILLLSQISIMLGVAPRGFKLSPQPCDLGVFGGKLLVSLLVNPQS